MLVVCDSRAFAGRRAPHPHRPDARWAGRVDTEGARAMATQMGPMAETMDIFTRSPNATGPESSYEKVMILPRMEDADPARHAWADARFAADILAEHALFFALLMPQEVAGTERAQALEFMRSFTALFERIDSAPPPERSELKRFVADVTEEVKPFVEYKARLGEAQTSGNLRSLVWPLFFDHTRNEAERWERRLDSLAGGETEFDRGEVVRFWTNIMDEHARFVAHLLDPNEYELIEKSFNASNVFRDLGGPGGAVATLVGEPGTGVGWLAMNSWRAER